MSARWGEARWAAPPCPQPQVVRTHVQLAGHRGLPTPDALVQPSQGLELLPRCGSCACQAEEVLARHQRLQACPCVSHTFLKGAPCVYLARTSASASSSGCAVLTVRRSSLQVWLSAWTSRRHSRGSTSARSKSVHWASLSHAGQPLHSSAACRTTGKSTWQPGRRPRPRARHACLSWQAVRRERRVASGAQQVPQRLCDCSGLTDCQA